MTKSGQNWSIKLALAICWAVGGAMSETALQTFIFPVNCAVAQIKNDSTLPINSSVKLEGNTRIIEGGTQAGNNLFHSFDEFSVPTKSIAQFNNSANIQNIISRVTGKSISNIDGLIRTNGSANLFLINTNGVVFGNNASLDVKGSFLATNAGAIKFGEQGFFSALNPNTPALLTVNPSALLFNQINAASTLQNNSVQGLSVPNGKSLLLVGSNVSMDGGKLKAPGGRVELGGVLEVGTVGLNVDGNNFSLSFLDGVARADVSLTNKAEVDVTAGSGGSIAVNARNFNVLGESSIRAGISLISEVDNAQAGDITLNATETVNIQNSSIYNAALGIGNGNGGNLNINTKQLIIRDGIAATATVSQGNSGNLIVNASDLVELTSSPSSNGTVSTKIPITIFGRSLDIPIRLPIGLFSASINAQNVIDTENIPKVFPNLANLNVLLSEIFRITGGNAGNLIINTGRLIAQDGAVIAAGTNTAGNAGNLSVNAREFIKISGTSPSNFPLNILQVAGTIPSGLRNGTAGSGKGGDLTIETGQLIISDGAWVGTNSSRNASAGELIVNALESVELIGVSSANGFPSFLATATVGSEDANSLTINTKRLTVRDGAFISAATAGSGQGGDLTINASESVELRGTSTKGLLASGFEGVYGTLAATEFNKGGPFPSGVLTGTIGEGNAGNLNINTGRLLIEGGAQASVSSTIGSGDAGSLNISATSVELIGTSPERPNPTDIVGRSLLTTAVGSGSSGKSGSIYITTDTLSVKQGAAISMSNAGSKDAGSLTVTANSIKLDEGRLTGTTASSTGGDITLNTRDFIVMRNNSTIATTAAQYGSGGNIRINSPFIIALPDENSDIIANADQGPGGQIRIKASGIYGLEERDPLTSRSDINASSNVEGLDGTIDINAPEVDLSRGAVNLPSVPVDTEVAQSCTAGGTVAKSEFIITGRGGLPSNPSNTLSTNAVEVNLVTLDTNRNERVGVRTGGKISTITSPSPIVEATGLIIDARGNVVLTANSSTVTRHNSWQRGMDCRELNQQQ